MAEPLSPGVSGVKPWSSWDESVIPLSVPDMKRRLAEGDPKVVYDGTTVRSRLLRDGEERLVAQWLRAVLTGA